MKIKKIPQKNEPETTAQEKDKQIDEQKSASEIKRDVYPDDGTPKACVAPKGLPIALKNISWDTSQLFEGNKKKAEGIFVDDGLTFRYTLNPQKSGFYLLKGTLSLLDPYNPRETMIFHDSKTGNKSTANYQIHVRGPRANEDLNALIGSEINTGVQILKCQYQDQYNLHLKERKLLSEMTFYEAEIAFLKDASRSVSESFNVQKNFCTSIRKFTKALQNVIIGKVKKADLNKIASSLEKGGKTALKDLKKFIKFCEERQMMSSGVLPVVEAALSSIPSEDDPGKKEHQKKEAANSDVLSNEAEEQLNHKLSENVCDPRYVCLGLVKGSGLDLKEVLELKNEQIQRYIERRDIVFIKIRRSYAGSATQDYTFPIFPFEAILLNDYINALIKAEGTVRMDEGKYLFSSDGGQTPVKYSEVTEICRQELMRLKFGYADLLGKVDLQKNKGVELLKKTYIERLEKYAGIDKFKDEGTFLFMSHKSMGNKVQADHYRGFTSESGREFLINLTQQDRRFLAKEEIPAKEETSCCIKGDRKEYVVYRKDQKNAQQVIIYLTLNTHELAEFFAKYGCEFAVEKIEYLDGAPESETLATAQSAKIESG